MNLDEKAGEQLWAIGLGCVAVACLYLLSLGKGSIIVCGIIGSFGAVWFFRRRMRSPILLDRGAVVGGSVGVLGSLFSFSLLGLAGKLGWSPAGDLAELSRLYERRGLTEAEISVIYNIFVGEPTLNGVALSIYLTVGLVGLVGGGLTALLLGGWKLRGSYVREKLYEWGILYRPGKRQPLPPAARMGFRLSFYAFAATVAVVLIHAFIIVLYEYFASNGLVFGVYFISMFLAYLAVLSIGLLSFLGYTITIFIFPREGNYMPARARAAVMAVLSIAVVMFYITTFYQ